MIRAVATGLIAACAGIATGCGLVGLIMRHTTNTSADPPVEAVRMPSDFQLTPPDQATPKQSGWMLAESTSVVHLPAPADSEAERFDLSPFLARDPWFGLWSSPLPTEQQIYLRSDGHGRGRGPLDPADWQERYVVQLAVNEGPEVRRGTDENARLSLFDVARVLCPAGVNRRLISSSPGDAIYESHFSRCSRFGPNRVVLTRELFGNWDSIRHSQAIYSFSYEIRGERITAAQRAYGLKLVSAPQLLMATEHGVQHPLWRDSRLRLVTAE
jgi:hypothetical protein